MVASNDNLHQRLDIIERVMAPELSGRVTGMTGLTVDVDDFCAPVGAQCTITTRHGGEIPAEVIGFKARAAVLMPLSDGLGISRGDRVRCRHTMMTVPIGEHLLGRVINGQGHPIDGKGPLLCQSRRPIYVDRLAPLDRTRIDRPLGTGVRAVDALMTIGCGQRMGIFSGPGVGKSVLLGMIARFTAADVAVIALVGERGREVREFLERDLGSEGMRRAVVVVSTSDEPAPIRVQASFVATTVAEYFRDQGNNVLLLMDSVTRVAMAQRQIGLAMGEPPATKGYTPSVFALLPRLIERCGRNEKGSITGFYTVLVEGDDLSEPISDAMRSILDGHLWLSRKLANRGHYPAVDVLESISRVMVDVTDPEHQQAARDITRLVAVYRDIEDLVNIGAYANGTNPEFDLAIRAHDAVDAFLQQKMHDQVTYEMGIRSLKDLVRFLRQGNTSVRESSPRGRQDAAAPAPANRSAMDRMKAGL